MKKLRVLGLPYAVWMAAFTVVPLAMMAVLAMKGQDGSFGFSNFTRFFTYENGMYAKVLRDSVVLALWTTCACLLLGYPVALFISHMTEKRRNLALILVIVPTWMNFLLRTYSWMNLLSKNGLINQLLSLVGFPAADMLYTEGAVILGMVYNFLPFMIYPIYSVIVKINPSYLEAARDLGAGPLRAFMRITAPLSAPGIVTGVTMVFMPAVSTFVIPEILGGSKKMYIGNLIQYQFLLKGDKNMGSAISLLMMIMILVMMFVTNRFDKQQGKESALW